MSKVVHLSDEAHNEAKEYCKQYGLRMSDWVGDLISRAIKNDHRISSVGSLVSQSPAVAQTQPPSPPPQAAPMAASVPLALRAEPARVVATVPDAVPQRAKATVETPADDASATDDHNVHNLVQKKKPLTKIEDKPKHTTEDVPPYAAPPFWAKG